MIIYISVKDMRLINIIQKYNWDVPRPLYFKSDDMLLENANLALLKYEYVRFNLQDI